MTTMTISPALAAHVAKLRIKQEESRCPITWVVLTDSTELERWVSNYGVVTPEDFDAASLWETYYDDYKSVHGIRPRWTSWKDRTPAEWRDALDGLAWEWERDRQIFAAQNAVLWGSDEDRSEAERWLREEEDKREADHCLCEEENEDEATRWERILA